MFIFEILGKPPEHIKETMSQLVDKLGELPGIKIDKKIIHEPKPIKDENAKDLFTTFAEVEILGKEINSLVDVMFHAMPSHVEIIEPEEIRLRNFDVSSLLSGLTVKLHRYDEIAKALTIERNVLIGKLKELGVRFEAPEQQLEKQKNPAKEKSGKKEKKKIKKSFRKNNSKKKK